jgi:hypothetical protein
MQYGFCECYSVNAALPHFTLLSPVSKLENLNHFPGVLQTVGTYEDAIFQKRMRELRKQKDRVGRQRYQRQQVRERERTACVHRIIFHTEIGYLDVDKGVCQQQLMGVFSRLLLGANNELSFFPDGLVGLLL